MMVGVDRAGIGAATAIGKDTAGVGPKGSTAGASIATSAIGMATAACITARTGRDRIMAAAVTMAAAAITARTGRHRITAAAAIMAAGAIMAGAAIIIVEGAAARPSA
jgi:uncharacterized RmlC-like cupin family protein